MSKRTILFTFIFTLTVVVFSGTLAYLMWKNQPSADAVASIVSPKPAYAPKETPAVPNPAQLAGDALDDGIVDSRDARALFVSWGRSDTSYNLTDQSADTGVINALDLGQVLKYWHCSDQSPRESCPYKLPAQ